MDRQEGEALVLRALAEHPGVGLTVNEAAFLTGLPRALVGRVLADLARARKVRFTKGRWTPVVPSRWPGGDDGG